jgi:hypothetical protein
MARQSYNFAEHMGERMEKRRYKRVAFGTEAVVRSEGVSISGTVSNLSMKGMFVTTKESLPGDNILEIEIVLSGSSSKLAIEVKGKLIRQTEEGIAVEFTEMDLDSFMHLKNVVAYNSEDADAVEEEYHKSIDSMDF